MRPLALFLLFTVACSHRAAPGSGTPAQGLTDQAEALAHRFIITDGHVDVPYRLFESESDKGEITEDISARTEKGNFDFVRARAGGLDAPFMSIYVPASYQESGGAKAFADRLIDMVDGFQTRWPDKFAVARSPAEVQAAVAAGKIALPMGMENGAPIEDDLANVQHFYDRGVRYITLTHSKDNHICDSSYDKSRHASRALRVRPKGGRGDEPRRHHDRRQPRLRRHHPPGPRALPRPGDRVALVAAATSPRGSSATSPTS